MHQLQNPTLSILHNLVLCPHITSVGKRKLQVQQSLDVIHFSGLRREQEHRHVPLIIQYISVFLNTQ